MERLTEWTGERWIATTKRVNGKLVGDKDIYALCAAYEDTGLTPEETAVLRQQLAEKDKEIENWRNRLHDMININGKIADQLARVIAERDDLRDNFIDYVTEGIPNPAPFCASISENCTNSRGWCEFKNNCKGFTPKYGEDTKNDNL